MHGQVAIRPFQAAYTVHKIIHVNKPLNTTDPFIKQSEKSTYSGSPTEVISPEEDRSTSRNVFLVQKPSSLILSVTYNSENSFELTGT